ncbi:winged helix-turn-helix domain-containing protein [Glaciecola sp. SC05]|uniref:winged helix-turn-helix domain-containing protein n=1 Tax=Glaciecola sp. SC05 TaxID=1987355 RepID=UPI00352964C6
MKVVNQNNAKVVFGNCSFNVDSGEFSDGTQTVRLEPQIGKLLVYLYCNQNKVISKNELIESLWESRVVSDHAFNRCLSLLRRTLNQDNRDAYIKTVPKRGYIASFPLANEDSTRLDTIDKAIHSHSKRMSLRKVSVAIISMCILSFAAIYVLQQHTEDTVHTSLSPSSQSQVAYVPTENMTAYRLYRDALYQVEQEGLSMSSPEYLNMLEEVVSIDPNFVRAKSELVALYSYLDFKRSPKRYVEKAEAGLAKIASLSPNSADFYYAQAAYIYYIVEDFNKAYSIINLAESLNNDDIRVLKMKLYIERRLNNYEALIRTLKAIRILEPSNPKWTEGILRALSVLQDYDAMQIEIETYHAHAVLQTGEIDFYHHLLDFRYHRDLSIFQSATARSCQHANQIHCGWIAHIANRDYQQALALFKDIDLNIPFYKFRSSHRLKMFTLWLKDQDHYLDGFIPIWLSEFEKFHQGNQFRVNAPLRTEDMVLLAVSGRQELALKSIDQYFQQFPIDWAERIISRSEICRILGMMGDSEKTVQCIEEGIEQGSLIYPFLEHYLPFYDAVRDTPRFMAMVQYIDGDAMKNDAIALTK